MVAAAAGATPSHHQHLAAVLAVCCGAAAALIATPSFTVWLHNLLIDSARHPLPPGTQCSFGVVLGYALHRNGSCTRPLQSRVEVGVDAFQQGDAARLIFSGAHPTAAPTNVSEANAMLSYALGLVTQQPQEGSWLLEEASTSTRTNAWFSLDIVAQHQKHQQQRQRQEQQLHALLPEGQQQPSSLLIITSPFHQLRSFYTFKRAAQQKGLQLQVFTAKAPVVGHCGYGHWLLDALMDQVDFVRELAALGWYGYRGWL